MSGTYNGGMNLTMILDHMEEKLRGWRNDLKSQEGVENG